jgi:hypothetical protein
MALLNHYDMVVALTICTTGALIILKLFPPFAPHGPKGRGFLILSELLFNDGVSPADSGFYQYLLI